MDGAKNMSDNYWGYSVKAWHGTTTVGLVIKDYVVLAADKRATAGFLIASRSVKITCAEVKAYLTVNGVFVKGAGLELKQAKHCLVRAEGPQNRALLRGL